MGIYYGDHIYGVRLRGPEIVDDRYTDVREFMGPGCVEAARAAWKPGDTIQMYRDTCDTYSGTVTGGYKTWSPEPDDIFGADEYGCLKKSTWE